MCFGDYVRLPFIRKTPRTVTIYLEHRRTAAQYLRNISPFPLIISCRAKPTQSARKSAHRAFRAANELLNAPRDSVLGALAVLATPARPAGWPGCQSSREKMRKREERRKTPRAAARGPEAHAQLSRSRLQSVPRPATDPQPSFPADPTSSRRRRAVHPRCQGNS